MKHERRHSSSGFRDDAVQQGAIGCKLKHSGIGTSNPHGERHSWIVSIRRRVVGYVRESRVRAALPFGQVWRPWRCAAARARECNLAGAWGVRRGRTHLPLVTQILEGETHTKQQGRQTSRHTNGTCPRKTTLDGVFNPPRLCLCRNRNALLKMRDRDARPRGACASQERAPHR